MEMLFGLFLSDSGVNFFFTWVRSLKLNNYKTRKQIGQEENTGGCKIERLETNSWREKRDVEGEKRIEVGGKSWRVWKKQVLGTLGQRKIIVEGVFHWAEGLCSIMSLLQPH